MSLPEEDITFGRLQYGSDLVVEILRRLGIEYVAFNPGATFRGIHDSLVNFAGGPQLIECCHEEISAAIAHGYFKACGKPMAVLTHNVVGLMHASMAIFNAWCDRVPMLVLGGTGPMDITKRRPGIDFIHTALVQGNLVRDYVKWDDQPYSLESIPESLTRAFRVTMAEPKGPVYVCFDIGLQESEITTPVPLPPDQAYLLPEPFQATASALCRAARLLLEAKKPVVVADLVGRSAGAFRALVDLAEFLGLPVMEVQKRIKSLNFPTCHKLNLSGDPEVLAEADLVLALEVDDLYGALNSGKKGYPLISQEARVIHIGTKELQRNSWVQAFQRYQRVDLPIVADLAVALPALLEECRNNLNGRSREYFEERRKLLEKRHNRLRQGWLEAMVESKSPISRPYLAYQLWETIKGEDWVLANGSLKGWTHRLWNFERPEQFLGSSGGAGLGYGMGASLGAALALRNSGKLVVNLQADGDFLFTPSALWTAAHYKLPMLVVMDNNRTYFNSENHQRQVAKARKRPLENTVFGTELNGPPVDFAALARSFGSYAEGPVTDPAEVRPALERALRVVKEEGRLALVDVVTEKG